MKPRPQRKDQPAIQRVLSTRKPISRRERTILMLIAVVAVGMRFALAAHISVEHWDEAVYSCNRFFSDGSYPARYLYAPPLLPAIIELSMLTAGPTSYAAVLPNLIFSTLTVILCWWAARDWFGRSAGLAAAALAALNDFHIAYSRTALTDPSLCFFFLLAVYFTWRALTRDRLREAVVAGVSAGAAWATKYNGWMTLAVALSAFVAWGLFERFSRKEWLSHLKVMGTIVLTALVSWSPVWFSFGPGQYSAVVQNQAGYFVGLSGWTASFIRQAANLRFFESWASAASLALAFGVPLVFHRGFRQLALAIILALEAIPIGITALLVGPALLGPGLILFSSYRRDRAGEAGRSRRLAAWLLWAWTLGFFVATPAYTPYPRLALPWLISALLATAAVSGMIFEPPTEAPNEGHNPRKYLRWVLIAVWILGPLATLQYRSINRSGWRFLPRDEKGHPQCELVLGNISIQARAHSKLPVPGWEDRTARGKFILEAAETTRQKVTEAGGPRTLHFLSYGEPAIVFHLNVNGFDVLPVTDLSFLEPGNSPLPQPAFLMAFSTDELKRLVQPHSNRLKVFGIFREFRGSPSDLVLLDKYPPSDLVGPGGRPGEELRLYRIEAH
jgi:4-amino-4-deoxy-L-arabinose transferase-like glycosyltransferase